MNRFSKFLVVSSILGSHAVADLQVDPTRDWPWWRGPNRDNHAATQAEPVTTFSATENILWKVEVPGRGHASPTVVGERLFLATADEAAETQSVVAFDRQRGEILWQTKVNQGGFPAKIHPKNTHASSTVASDGERVFSIFYNHDSLQVSALSAADGKMVWSENLGPYVPKQYEFGFGASPVIYGENVIVLGDIETGGFLTALDRKTGKRAWSTQRPKIMNYSSPTVARFGATDQLLVSGCERVAAYDPLTGKLLWEKEGASATVTCGTVVWDGDLIFASGGYPNKLTTAVRAGTGEIVWQNNKKIYEQSMIAYQGHLYAINDNGIAYCWSAQDGEERWSERLKGPISASPVLVGDRLYAANEAGAFFVFRANPNRWELLATNQLGDECFATPTIVGGRLYARVTHVDDEGERGEMLYCVGTESEDK